MSRWIDPTDDHRPAAGLFDEALDALDALDLTPYTLPLTEEHWQRGICSDPTCSKAISGWCIGCGSKLCIDHLQDHRNAHAREQIAALRASGRSDA